MTIRIDNVRMRRRVGRRRIARSSSLQHKDTLAEALQLERHRHPHRPRAD
jgi:hypothetical protein